MSSPFNRDAKKQERTECEKELDEALEDLDEALERANGNCKRKIATRTTRIRRRLADLAEESED